MENPSRRFNILSMGFAWLSEAALFLSSYTLLFVALALRFDYPGWLPKTCWALAALGICGAAWILTTWRLRGHVAVRIESVEERGAEVGGYLTTYLLPIAVIGAPTTNDLLAYFVVLCAIGIVYVRAGLLYVNPTIYLCGFRPYFIVTDDGFRGYLLARKRPRGGDEFEIVQRGQLMMRV